MADGGTGASDAAGARTNLGLGTIATQNSNNVTITGGSITGITDLPLADGGTGASDAAGARVNLDVPSRTGLGASGTWEINITGNSANGGVTSVNGATGTVTLGLLGQNQTWALVRDNRSGTITPTRSGSTWYQNTTGRPIMVTVWGSVNAVNTIRIGPATDNYVSITTPDGDSGEWQEIDPIIIPVNHYYYIEGTGIERWWELK